MRPTVLLFDVDGTLVTCAGAGRRAIARAFDAAFGRPDAVEQVQFGGMTDRAIARAGLRAIGAPAVGAAGEAAITAVLACYVGLLAEELDRTDGVRLHPGVAPLLAGLHPRPHLAVGLGTGNIREGARLKLEHAGIFAHFAFGGFGCDAEDRARLLAVGAERGAARLGRARDACRTIVIGDTPRDAAAAQAIGAECLAVGTSGVALDTLRAAGATWAVADLAEPLARDALAGENIPPRRLASDADTG